MRWIFVSLLAISIYANANGAMDYNLHYAQPAYQESAVVFGLVNQSPAQKSDKLLAFYKLLSTRVSHLKDLLEGVNKNYSPIYIQSGGLSRSVYYVDYGEFIMNAFHYSESGYVFIRDHKELITHQRTLPDLISLAISLGDKKLEALELMIKKSSKDEVVEEQKRELRLKKEQEKLKELEALVAKSSQMSQHNDQIEAKIELEKKQREKKLQQRYLAQTHRRETASITSDMAVYATIIGRAGACGLDTSDALRRVGRWLDDVFPPGSNEQQQYLPIFVKGLKYHAEQQMNGSSPDNCESVRKAFNEFDWP